MRMMRTDKLTDFSNAGQSQIEGAEADKVSQGPKDLFVSGRAAKPVSKWETTGAWAVVALSAASSTVYGYCAGKCAGCDDGQSYAYTAVAALTFVTAALSAKQAIRLSVDAGIRERHSP